MKLDGFCYIATNRAALQRIVDQRARPPKPDTVAFNGSVYLSAKGATQAGTALRVYLEWQTHKRVAAAEPLWTALHRAGVADAPRQFLGFVPTSPDGSRWRYDARRAEVTNERHGNRREPRLHDTLAVTAPLTGLLEQLQWLRADLRFRGDGIHTTVTLRRAPAK